MAIGMRTMAFTTLMAAAVASSAALTAYKTVDVEVSESSTYAIECMQGETFEWRFRHIQDGAPLDLTGAQTALLAWTAKGTNYAMEGSVYDATNGVARYVWASTNASPAGTYQYVASVSTGAVVLARARGTLTVLRGVTVGGEVPVWSGVTQDTLGASGAVWRAEWQGADDAVVDVATEALDLAQAALPKAATNGAEWGSHAGLATTGSVASAVGTATNLADVAATAALDSMMRTGRIYRAEAARMLEAANGRAWMEFGTNGAVYVVSLTNTTSVVVTDTAGVGYNGPSVGTTWTTRTIDGESIYYDAVDTWFLGLSGGNLWLVYKDGYEFACVPDSESIMPKTTENNTGDAAGALTINWVYATNVYIIATEPTVITISQNAVDEHNEDGDAHPTLARQSSLAGYVETNRVLTINGTAYDLSADRSWTVAASSSPTWYRVPIGDWSASNGTRPTMTRVVSSVGFVFSTPTNAMTSLFWQGSRACCTGWTGVVVRVTYASTTAAAGQAAWRSTVGVYTNATAFAATSTVNLPLQPITAGGVYTVSATNLITNSSGFWGGAVSRLSNALGGDTADTLDLVAIEYLPLGGTQE